MATSPIENPSVRNCTEFVRYLIKNEIKLRIRIQHNTRVAQCRNGTVLAYNFFGGAQESEGA